MHDADLTAPLANPLTRNQLRTRIVKIVHEAFPLPHGADALRYADMTRLLVDLAEEIATGRHVPPDGEVLLAQVNDVPQVCLHPAIVDAFGVWLASRGMFLFRIPTGPDALPTYGIGVTDERANRADLQVCTGVAASWCPRCGSCLCRTDRSGCPLHRVDSRHGEPAPADPQRSTFIDEGHEWLRLSTDAHSRWAWLTSHGLDDTARPDEVIAAVGRSYTRYGTFADAPPPAG